MTETVKFAAIDRDKSISAEELITTIVNNQTALAGENNALAEQLKALHKVMREMAGEIDSLRKQIVQFGAILVEAGIAAEKQPLGGGRVN